MQKNEGELLVKYRPVTTKFLAGRTDLQLIAIYAVQAAWFALGSPKGKVPNVCIDR